MEQILVEVSDTVAEIRALRYMQSDKFRERYETLEDRYARQSWQDVWSEASITAEKAGTKWDKDHPTDRWRKKGLPEAFLKLDEECEAAEAARRDYQAADEGLRLVGFEPSFLEISNPRLIDGARKLLTHVREKSTGAHDLAERLKKQVDAKSRAGTVVFRLREENRKTWGSGRRAAVDAAYKAVIEAKDGRRLEQLARAAEKRTKARRDAEIKPLAEKLAKLIDQALTEVYNRGS